MKPEKILMALLCIFSFSALGQNHNIGIGTTLPDSSAALDIKSSSQGILIPRMTLQSRNLIANPATGLMIFQTDSTSGFYYYDGDQWTPVSSGNLQLADNDNDTKIQVEESADEDIIRFDMGGTEYFRMEEGRIGVSNTGGSVYIGEASGENDDFYDNANIGIGDSTLHNTTGRANIAIGPYAMQENTTGNLNNAYGYGALRSNTTGISNTAIGVYALRKNTSGRWNVGIGVNTLGRNTTGDFNVSTGSNSMFYNTTGSYNTASGYYTLLRNTSGSDNTSFGAYSLSQNTTGRINTANGKGSMEHNISGNYNAAYGAWSLRFHTSGNFNTALGYDALHTDTTGTNNTAVGARALYAHKSGSNNTALGYYADVTNAGLTNATAIGANTKVSQSNSLVLGNNANVGIGTSAPNAKLSLGTFNSGSSGDSVQVLLSGAHNIGVNNGSTNGTYKLKIEGYQNDGLLVYPIFMEDENKLVDFYIKNRAAYSQKPTMFFAGNIGVGTETPQATLDLLGNIKITDGTQGYGKVLLSDSNGVASWASPHVLSNSFWSMQGAELHSDTVSKTKLNSQLVVNSTSGIGLTDLISSSTVGSWLTLENTSTGGGKFNLISTGSANGEGAGKLLFRSQYAWDNGYGIPITIDSMANVGIGTTSPSSRLHVNGTSHFESTSGDDLVTFESSSSIGSWLSLGNSTTGGKWFNIISTGVSNGEGAGKLLFSASNNPKTTQGIVFSIDGNTGNVGVGTHSPNTSAALDVSSTNKGMLIPRMTEAQRNLISSPATGLMVFQTDASPGFYFYDGANWTAIKAGDTEAEQSATYNTDWSDYGVGYKGINFYLNDGRVYIEGFAKKSTAVVAGDVIFTLPAGYRPASRIILTGSEDAAPVQVDILPNGEVKIMAGFGTNNYISLSGMSFRAN